MARTATAKASAAESALAAEFAARQALPGGQALADTRAAAFARFEHEGLPTRRLEQWKYTDLHALMRAARPIAVPPDHKAKEQAKSAGSIVAGVATHRIVFVEGAYVPELSGRALEAGLSVTPLSTALAGGDAELAARVADAANLARDDSILALNTAMMSDGAIVRVEKGAIIDKPVHLVFVRSSAATATFTRSQVIVGPNAKVTLIETHEGPDDADYQANNALDLIVGEGAQVDHIKVASEGKSALHLATMTVQVGARAQLKTLGLAFGEALARNQLFVQCAGDQSEVTVAGAALLRGRAHADTTLVFDHVGVGCRSREVFKSVLEDQARGVFQGRIAVQPGAQKTDARMLMQALLLSEHAEADHKPELEIFADDVQCGHGSTAGALDENLKFYLMARGISEKEAELLLVQAFVAEAVDTVVHEGLRDALMFATVRWLGQRQ
jgi:Fe-S cluster assembly protein SufD